MDQTAHSSPLGAESYRGISSYVWGSESWVTYAHLPIRTLEALRAAAEMCFAPERQGQDCNMQPVTRGTAPLPEAPRLQRSPRRRADADVKVSLSGPRRDGEDVTGSAHGPATG